MRRVLGVLAVGGVSAGAVLVRRARRRERELLDIYFEDGSVISLGASRPEAARLMPLARRVLANARG